MTNKPNIILINADDLGYGDLSCYGATKVQTPNIDRLAAEGKTFRDAHAASAVCSPSRYGMLTGRYPIRRNFWGPTGMDQALSIDTGHLTLASLLKGVGYSTAVIGKWHLGLGETKPDWNSEIKPGPLEIGFDYCFILPNVNCIPPYVYVENHRVVGWDPEDPFVYGVESVTEKWPAKGGYNAIGGAKNAHLLYRDEMVGTTLKEKSVEWIRKNGKGDNPFFLYLAPLNIHHPFTPAPQFKGTSQCGLYGDFIHELDWIVGEVVKAVEEIGATDNTLIIFTSDNGGMLNQGGQDAWKAGHRLNGDLLGFKFGAWEGGHRIPFIAKWPGKIEKDSVSDQLFSQIDLMATFANIAGRPLKEGEGVDSIDQLEALTGSSEENIREQLVISPNSPEHLLVRKGNWVYIPAQDEGGFQQKNIGDHGFGGAAVFKLTKQTNSDFTENGVLKPDAPPAQLYDLEKDPYQSTNLYYEFPDLVKELDSIITEHRKLIGPYEELGWIAIRQKKMTKETEEEITARFIDTHVHFYSCNKGDLDIVAKWMKANNIQRVINHPLEPSRPKTDAQRKQMLENYSKYKCRIERFCIIKPDEISTLEETVEILQQEIKDGAIGFGEHYGENLNFDAPKNMMLYAACNQVGLPAMFHIDSGRNRDEKGLPGLQNVLKTYPDLILIAHSSGWWKHLEEGTCEELLQKYPNLYADISCSMKQPLIRDMKFAKNFMTRNADKLLFGSDTTWNSFEKGIPPEFALFDELDLPKEVESNILRENALKLFKVNN